MSEDPDKRISFTELEVTIKTLRVLASAAEDQTTFWDRIIFNNPSKQMRRIADAIEKSLWKINNK